MCVVNAGATNKPDFNFDITRDGRASRVATAVLVSGTTHGALAFWHTDRGPHFIPCNHEHTEAWAPAPRMEARDFHAQRCKRSKGAAAYGICS